MAVKIKETVNFGGEDRLISVYLPPNVVLTGDARAVADKIDVILQDEVAKINTDFQRVAPAIRSKSFLKWKWLSNRLSKLISLLKKNGLLKKDLDDNLIWVPIAQYLCDELSVVAGNKRSGTHKDHYRKVYLLSQIKGLGWIDSWFGWDAFADRGDAVLQHPGIFAELEKKFGKIQGKLNTKDYQFIAKELAQHLRKREVSAISRENLVRIADEVFRKYKEKRGMP